MYECMKAEGMVRHIFQVTAPVAGHIAIREQANSLLLEDKYHYVRQTSLSKLLEEPPAVPGG